MRLRHLYLAFCVIGTVVPYWEFVSWVMEHGLKFPILFHELFATRVGAFFGLDVVISGLVLFLFIAAEGRRFSLSARVLPIIGTLLVGVSLGFPLFLYLRQRELDDAPPR